jgi:hypothetical protein
VPIGGDTAEVDGVGLVVDFLAASAVPDEHEYDVSCCPHSSLTPVTVRAGCGMESKRMACAADNRGLYIFIGRESWG